MNTPAKQITLEIKGNSYEVKFPNTGDLLDIEVIKNKMSEGTYSAFFGTTISASYARSFIDMIATFNVLIPDLKKDLNVKGMAELEILDSMELLKVYKDTFLPWYNEWMLLLSGLGQEEEA